MPDCTPTNRGMAPRKVRQRGIELGVSSIPSQGLGFMMLFICRRLKQLKVPRMEIPTNIGYNMGCTMDSRGRIPQSHPTMRPSWCTSSLGKLALRFAGGSGQVGLDQAIPCKPLALGRGPLCPGVPIKIVIFLLVSPYNHNNNCTLQQIHLHFSACQDL